MNATALSDTDLVAQILAGQRDAFAVLVERHLHSALAIARARLLNPADADDAVQEAFLRAYRGLRTLREPAKFGPWLLTIARHEAARLVVKGRSTLGADPAGAPDLAAAAEPEPLRAELHAQLRDHIANLPETAREVLLLHYFAGRTTREIAALLDIRQGAVLKRLQRARESLAETLLRDLETERPSRDALNKKAVHIAALTAGLAIQQTATASAASIAAALLVPKAATIAAGFVGAAVTIGSISAFVWQTRGHEISASQVHEVATVDDTGTQRSSASKRPALPNAARAQNASNQRPTSSNGAAGNGDTTDVQARPEPTKNTAFPGQSGPSGSVTLKFENAHI